MAAPVSVRIELTPEDVAALRDVAHFYDKSLGAVRFVVRSTSSREIRSRFRFVAEESDVLEAFARSLQGEMQDTGEQSRTVTMTVRALVAYWGRILASLENRRSRRKLSEEEIARREALATKIAEAARRVNKRHPTLLAREIETRRPVEAEWMRERLAVNPA